MFSFNTFPDFPAGRTFQATYKCFSVSVLGDREDVERGGKIIMPPSALDQLSKYANLLKFLDMFNLRSARLNIQYPMLFRLTNKKTNRETHCGVLEFVADEGRIFLPYWIMRNLYVDEGDFIQVDNVSLAVATYAKFQPQSVDFLDISNPKAVLENALRNFACLTQGDVVAIKYNDKEYELCVLESKPGKAVSIIECDMIVDFAPSVGYIEPERKYRRPEQMDCSDMETDDQADDLFRPFAGLGNRLDGKKKDGETVPSQSVLATPGRRGIPNYNFKRGTITFIRKVLPANADITDEEEKHFEAFSGQGQSLKTKSRK